MKLGSASVTLGLLVACAAWAHTACAQQPDPDLQKQVDALRAQVGAMQKDLDEIKALLAPLRGRPSSNVTIDLGNRPVKGQPAAKVTLVELTDYQ